MSKYKDALDDVSEDFVYNLNEALREGAIDQEEFDERMKSLDTLQELVDRAESKKLLNVED